MTVSLNVKHWTASRCLQKQLPSHVGCVRIQWTSSCRLQPEREMAKWTAVTAFSMSGKERTMEVQTLICPVSCSSLAARHFCARMIYIVIWWTPNAKIVQKIKRDLLYYKLLFFIFLPGDKQKPLDLCQTVVVWLVYLSGPLSKATYNNFTCQPHTLTGIHRLEKEVQALVL